MSGPADGDAPPLPDARRRVRLRAIEPTDRETYFSWDQDSEQARHLYAVPFPRSREATNWSSV